MNTYYQRFENADLSAIVDLILQWQVTQENDLLLFLLVRFEKFIFKIIHSERRKFYALRNEDLEDLFQISIFGFINFLNTFPQDGDERDIFLRLKGYVQNSLRSHWRDIRHDIVFEPSVIERIRDEKLVNDGVSCDREIARVEDVEDCKHLLSLLSPKKRELLEARFIEGKTYQQIAQREGVKISTVHKKVRQGIEEIKQQII